MRSRSKLLLVKDEAKSIMLEKVLDRKNAEYEEVLTKAYTNNMEV